MHKNKLYIFLLLLCTSISLCAQDKGYKDTTISKLIKSHFAKKRNFNYYEADKDLDSALQVAKQKKYRRKEGELYTLKGKLQTEIEEKDNAIDWLTKAITIQHETNDKKNLAKSFYIFGDIYFSRREFDKALNSYNTAKSIFIEKNMKGYLADILLQEGKTYLKLKNYKKAKKLIDESIKKSRHRPKTLCEGYINLANIYSHYGNHTKALDLSKKGLDIALEKKYSWPISIGYLSLANTNNKLKNYKESSQLYKKYIASSESHKTGRKANIKLHKRNKAVIQNQSQKLKKTTKELDKEKDKNFFGALISILSVALIIILSLLTLSLYKNNNIRLKTNNMLYKKNNELTLAKEKAELASKTKANFLSTVTHELRTPLYAVTGLSNMLLDENPKPDQIQHLKSLKFSGDYLLTFINDILQINKIEANKVNIELESFNLRKKINNIILALNNSAEDNNIKIHFSYPKGLPENFVADQLKISQILINLIGNSIKFTKNGFIWIRLYEISKVDNTYNIRFEIEDNGIGISEEKQNNIFESFSQGSIQINRKYGGTGLGLSIVKGLIQLLKGKIYLKSTLNQGTTFYFEIPLELDTDIKRIDQDAVLLQKNIKEVNLNKVKILIVEDNKINQMITKKILTKMKLDCEIVDNGEDAVDLVKTNQYSLVLMDIHMPGISGIEATKRIRAFDKNLTIFALTAVTIEDKMQEFNEAGFTDIIPKPFKQSEFEKKLFGALSKNKNLINS